MVNVTVAPVDPPLQLTLVTAVEALNIAGCVMLTKDDTRVHPLLSATVTV